MALMAINARMANTLFPDEEVDTIFMLSGSSQDSTNAPLYHIYTRKEAVILTQ
jgi:hypothetical protein